MRLAARGHQGPWWQSPLATGDAEDSPRPLVPSERCGLRPQPSAQRDLDARQPWKCWNSGGMIDGREGLMHPYLARQMSDFGFRKPLRGLNSGVCVRRSKPNRPAYSLISQPSATSSKGKKDTSVYPGLGHLAV